MNMGKETEQLEFKKSTGELKEGIISLASMLNKNGKGILYFGVRNDGEVVGQQIGDRTMRDISQGIAHAIKPQIIPTIVTEYCDEKNIIKVTAEGNEKPYSAYGKYYMRLADEDREISPGQLRSLMLSASDSIVHMESTNQELSFEQLKTLYAGKDLTLRESTFEQNLNLLTRDGTYNLMANILSDSNSYSIKVAVFRGTDKTDLIRRNEYGYKCMLVAAKQVLDYMEALNETAVDLSGSLREESKLFDFSCFREAWMNACLHNRWSRQTPPAVYVFDDRIEIISIGGLPEGLSLEEFYAGKSKPVNPELQQIMVQLDYIEQTGHGVPLIVSRYGKEVFDITENFVTVTIPINKKSRSRIRENKSPDSESFRNTDKDPHIKRSAKIREYVPYHAKDAYILELMEENEHITIRELSEKLGLGTTTITKRIQALREEGTITRRGSKKAGSWEVHHKPLP